MLSNDINSNKKITLLPLLFNIKLDENDLFPLFLEALFRGGFGYILKNSVCQKKNRKCNECLLKSTCIYIYLFETQAPKDIEKIKKYEHVPKPYTMCVRKFDKTKNTVSIEITLIGKSITYLPYFIYVFNELGKKGLKKDKNIKFELRNVINLNNNKQIYQNADDTITTDSKLSIYNLNIEENYDNKTQDYIIDMVTPIRMQSNGKIINKLNWNIFFRNIIRKIKLISLIHGDGDPNWNTVKLINNAQKAKIDSVNIKWDNSRKRYSTRQQSKICMSGLIGSFTLYNLDKNLHKLIEIGSYLHIGKGTTFGLGKYVYSLKS